MGKLHIDENTEIGNTGFTLKQVLNDIGALYERSTKVSDEMIKMSKVIVNEFIIFEGDNYYVNNGNWQFLADYYSMYGCIINKYPLRDGYTRSYKLCLDKTDGVIRDGVNVYTSIFNTYTQEHVRDYLWDVTWGGTTSGTRTHYEQDFDINDIIHAGHVSWKTTLTFATGGSYPFRIYKLYLKIIDTYNGVPY